MMLISYWRELLICTLAIVIAVGIAAWPKLVPPVSTNKTQTTVVEKVVSPDGTITERVVTRDVVASVPVAPKKYRVGVEVDPLQPKQKQTVTGGVRLGDLPLWLQGSYQIQRREGTIGFSLDF